MATREELLQQMRLEEMQQEEPESQPSFLSHLGLTIPSREAMASTTQALGQARQEQTPQTLGEVGTRLRGGAASVPGELAISAGFERGGQIVGGMLGAPGGPVGVATGVALGGAGASALALQLNRLLQGKDPATFGEMGVEGLMTFVPEAVEPVVKRGLRGLVRSTPAAQVIRAEQATDLAQTIPERVFQPRTREEVGAIFDEVRASGTQFDLGPVSAGIADLTQGQTDDLLRNVRRLDRQFNTGGRWEALVQGIAEDSVASHDIGDLQALHSAMRKRIEGLTEGKQLLKDFNDDIDVAIFQAPTTGATAGTVARLAEARRGWAKIRGSEELSDLLEDAIGATSDASRELLSVSRFSTQLRRNKTTLAKAVNRALEALEGGRPAFDAMMKEVRQFFKVIETPLASDVSGFARSGKVAGVMRFLSDQMLEEPEELGRIMRKVTKEARQVVLDPKIPLPAGKLTVIFNTLRRALVPNEAVTSAVLN